MRIVFLGTGAFGAPALRALKREGHEVLRAVSQPDRPAGRGRTVEPTPIRAEAEALGVPHVQCPDVNALDAGGLCDAAELGVVVAFGQKLGPALLSRPPRGFVNIHASLLPKYRGAAPIQWAIIQGEKTTGVTVFQLNEQWDAGAVWGRRAVEIGETETAAELHDRLAALGAELIVEVVDAIARGEVQPAPQDAAQATRAPKLTTAQRRIDFSQPADRVVRLVNGLWSWPAATCLYAAGDAEPLRVQRARAAVVDLVQPPCGTFAPGAFCEDGRVQTGRGRVRILEIKPAGRPLMPFESFANARPARPPARLLPLPIEQQGDNAHNERQ